MTKLYRKETIMILFMIPAILLTALFSGWSAGEGRW